MIPGAGPGFGLKGGPAFEVESCRRSRAELCEQSELSVTVV